MPQWLINIAGIIGFAIIGYFVIWNLISLILGRYRKSGGSRVYTKKLYIGIGLFCTLLVVMSSIQSIYDFKVEASQKEAISMLKTLETSAEAAFAELGEYPPTFEELGFVPVCNNGIVLKYKSMKSKFIASVINKNTDHKLSLAKDRRYVEEDLLKSSPDVQTCGQ